VQAIYTEMQIFQARGLSPTVRRPRCGAAGGAPPRAAWVWGKPPDRGATTPRHEPGTGREQSRNTPLGG